MNAPPAEARPDPAVAAPARHAGRSGNRPAKSLRGDGETPFVRRHTSTARGLFARLDLFPLLWWE